MAGQPNTYNDGNWTAGFNYGADKITYPFINYPIKDTNAKVYEVTRAVLPVNYTPQAALATYSGNPNAYLVDESDIQIDPLQRARYSLKFATIPSNQSQGISRSITRPPPRNTLPNGNSPPSPLLVTTASTTTAADGAVIGNCLVSASLGATGILCAPIYPITSYQGSIAFVSNTYSFNASNYVGLYSQYGRVTVNGVVTQAQEQDIYFAAPGTYNIVNSTAINFAPTLTNLWTAVYAAPYVKPYAPGTPTIRTNQTESFYLPTISAGVNVFSDIPLPNIIANDIDYFNAIAANSPVLGANVVTYDYDGPTVWMGPIYKIKQWTVKCSDL